MKRLWNCAACLVLVLDLLYAANHVLNGTIAMASGGNCMMVVSYPCSMASDAYCYEDMRYNEDEDEWEALGCVTNGCDHPACTGSDVANLCEGNNFSGLASCEYQLMSCGISTWQVGGCVSQLDPNAQTPQTAVYCECTGSYDSGEPCGSNTMSSSTPCIIAQRRGLTEKIFALCGFKPRTDLGRQLALAQGNSR